MNKQALNFLFILISPALLAGGIHVGEKAEDFRLKNVDGKMVSLSDYKDAKGFVVVFTCNHCPYAIAYQDRLLEIDKKYKSLGYPVIAINSNDEKIVPDDSFAEMIKRAKEKNFTFPYLRDEDQMVVTSYGAERTPHVYLLNREGKDLIVKYIGAIDDNYKDPGAVSQKYLENAINALLKGTNPDPSYTKAIGCTIKMREM
ncbi:MAG TPA: thioredoxin family protein [Bacteroidales bacterium]|nr:thioredoxin family protein [Bacteroidales bacterium]